MAFCFLSVTVEFPLFSLEIFLEKGSIVLNGLRTKSGNYGDEILTIKPNSENESALNYSEERFEEKTELVSHQLPEDVGVHCPCSVPVDLWVDIVRGRCAATAVAEHS
jgi:hypothetical protein